MPTHYGLCENTIAFADSNLDFPCFVVGDLQDDDRFCNLPIVDGSMATFRSYAGTPITTSRGVRIGSFFMYDNDPRPSGLSSEERKCQSPIHA